MADDSVKASEQLNASDSVFEHQQNLLKWQQKLKASTALENNPSWLGGQRLFFR